MSTSEAQQTAKRKSKGMDGNLSIGRFGGIEVRLNWSLLAVVALIVWSLADGVFPSQNPGLSDNTYLGMAVVASILFLAAITLHELGHSWVARREGLEVDSITLWLFGGVAQLKGRFPSPGAEFRVAVSGPLVSIGLGVLFMAIAATGPPTEVDGVAAWLGYINLILAAFNLLPASPLDGGRVLHSALWRAKGDFAWATRVASEIGQVFGYLFIALGLAMLVFQGSFSGGWLAFIGWFLLQGARAEARYVATEQALQGLRVRDLMVRHPVTVDADSTVGRFMDEVAGLEPVHHLSRPRGRPAGRPPRLRVGRRGSPLRLGCATGSGHDAPARPGPAAHRGRAGRGRPRGAVRADRESRARRGRRTPGRAAVDHRHRTSPRSRPKPGPGTVLPAGVSLFAKLHAETRLPGFDGATGWLNSEPLTPEGLRGKVVLVDFWTYTCINWLRTLGYVRAWHEKYEDRGLVVVGVHTPEFPFERDADNVRWAAEYQRVEYPIALDPDYEVWRAFANNYWPAVYIADAEGRIRHTHFGEGGYEECEMMVQMLLREADREGVPEDLVSVADEGFEAQADWQNLGSPETYLGYEQGQNFASANVAEFDEPQDVRRAGSAGAQPVGAVGELDARPGEERDERGRRAPRLSLPRARRQSRYGPACERRRPVPRARRRRAARRRPRTGHRRGRQRNARSTSPPPAGPRAGIDHRPDVRDHLPRPGRRGVLLHVRLRAIQAAARAF